MSEKTDPAWEKISLKAIDSALLKLNRISAGKWAVDETAVLSAPSPEDYDAVCVYFEVKKDDEPMNFALFFDRKDVGFISKCFIGYHFFVSEKMDGTEELLISELGNILLNSIISALCNSMKIRLIPSIPRTIQAEKSFALETFSQGLPENRGKKKMSVKIKIKCDGRETFCEVFSFVPESVAALLKG